MFEDVYQDHLAAKTLRAQERDACEAPFNEKGDAAATYTPRGNAEANIDSTLASILAGAKKPNEKQGAFLMHFVRRLKVEVLGLLQGKINIPGESLLDFTNSRARARAPSSCGCDN